jgi:Fe-Mn family superoxide dismutase
MPTHVTRSSSSAVNGRGYNQARGPHTTRFILILLAVLSLGVAVYVAEATPKRSIHTNPRVYQNALPYSLYALEPFISAETMDYHYNRHDYGYEKKLLSLIANNTELKSLPLLDIVARGKSDLPPGVYNNAGQLFNHNIFWESMTPNVQLQYPFGLSKELQDGLNATFGSYESFIGEFTDKATNHFGSGWVWALYNKTDSVLRVVTTPNGDYPEPVRNVSVLFNLDVWEHSYYIDYRNNRTEFIKNFIKIINWKFASDNYRTAIRHNVPVI